jgi:hypothetical protein
MGPVGALQRTGDVLEDDHERLYLCRKLSGADKEGVAPISQNAFASRRESLTRWPGENDVCLPTERIDESACDSQIRLDGLALKVGAMCPQRFGITVDRSREPKARGVKSKIQPSASAEKR